MFYWKSQRNLILLCWDSGIFTPVYSIIACIFKYLESLRKSWPRLTLPNNPYTTFRNYYKHSKKWIRYDHVIQRKKNIEVFGEEDKCPGVWLWAFSFLALRIAQPISFTNTSVACWRFRILWKRPIPVVLNRSLRDLVNSQRNAYKFGVDLHREDQYSPRNATYLVLDHFLVKYLSDQENNEIINTNSDNNK